MTPAKEALVKCVYPSCNEQVKQVDGSPAFCDKHVEMFEFVKWMLSHVQMVQKPNYTRPIILPTSGIPGGMTGAFKR